MQHLIIYTFKRSRRKQCVWKPCRIVLKGKVRQLHPKDMHIALERCKPLLLFASRGMASDITDSIQSMSIERNQVKYELLVETGHG